MQKYFDSYKQMISLRGLTDHTIKSYCTHLYENGTDLLTIKALLGHKSLNSTIIYVSLAANGVGRAVSPFDSMGDSANA